MDELKEYGDLSEEELSNFLSEIKDDGDEIEQLDEESVDSFVDEDAEMMTELPENREIESYYGEKAWRKAFDKGTYLVEQDYSRTLHEKIKKKAQQKKADRIRIQRMAFNQIYFPLSKQLNQEQFRYLISTLTEKSTEMIFKYETRLNHRIHVLLRPFIPRRIRVCMIAFPDSIRISPGFLYRASKEYGNSLTFWACPNLPVYFEQGQEQRLIEKYRAHFLYHLDRSIVMLNEHKKRRDFREGKIATILVSHHVNTWFDLLRQNPFWFEIVYNKYIQELNNLI